ncbi:MAG TPA: hypothetical protein VG276_17275 [Actinomycetes bacterium]|jgi:hypothetical protein|nr:hypothetical protein [Actinomycetes bacterium]
MPGRTYRRSIWPIYPGVVGVYLFAMLGYLAALLGFRLPVHVPTFARVVLELVVVLLVVLALRALFKARKAFLRLFKAQTLIAYAVSLQAILLLLPN